MEEITVLNEKEIDGKANGILLVNKPSGISTYDVIRRVKKKLDFAGKIGHAGTLDVFADGLVVLLLGGATKKFADFQEMDKEYTAVARLGFSSETLDKEGKIIEQKKKKVDLEKLAIERALKDFVGQQEQDVPKYSATKQGGQPMYKLARKGLHVGKRRKIVDVYELELLNYKYPLAKLRVVCSSGTYIRQLSYDIFKKLGFESYLEALKRTRIGEYDLDEALEIV